MAAPRRAAITGAPGGGKSSLLDALARRGVATVGEVAREILRGDGGMALRREDPAQFAIAMLDAQLARWMAIETGRADVVVFDRGFPDIAGFLQVEGLPIPPRVDEACRALRFDGPIFRAHAWSAIYRPDAERIQDWEEAVASDEAVAQAWRDYGYELVDLPRAPVDDRAEFVIARLG